MFEIVLGTNNRKKGLELSELLEPHEIAVKTLADFSEKLTVQEDGETFIDNARKKAREQAIFLNRWVIGEDSGLCVDALDGAPGVFSARFAADGVSHNVSANSSDADNNRFLLERLADIPLEKRTAHYVCTAAVADPTGEIRCESKGLCRGRILFEPSGTGGFGYDPLFEVIEYHSTFGALTPAVKRAISHRARAMRSLIPLLLEVLLNRAFR
ncbi:MAG: RdgB/HAM1 family non-canonical purine NTP pyrophosphatase [Planctomycetaceae bacterium]|nr:RdgB/HAM1 family non-canonical purine NTP pyrophosphatase [Planctomycetaceae bacterium]